MADSATSFNLASPFLTAETVALVLYLGATPPVDTTPSLTQGAQLQLQLRIDPVVLARSGGARSMILDDVSAAGLRAMYADSEGEDRALAAEGLDDYFDRLDRDDEIG